MQKAIQGYAEHMRTEDFRTAIDAVLAEAAPADEGAEQVAVMCSPTSSRPPAA